MKASHLALVAGLGAAGLSILLIRQASAKYEEPQWVIIKKQGDLELRKYPRLVAASVTVSGTDEKAANRAFSILAGYIFGKNSMRRKLAMTVPVTEQIKSEKIAMTVPVTTSLTENSITMSFYMPSKYDMDSLPEALDKRIEFSVVSPRAYAAIRFSGRAKEDSIRRHTSILEKFMQEISLTASGEPVRAFYDPPWALPFLRRNEVWIPVQLTE